MKVYIDETGSPGNIKIKDGAVSIYKTDAYIGSYIATLAGVPSVNEKNLIEDIESFRKSIKTNELKSTIWGKNNEWVDRLSDVRYKRIEEFINICKRNNVKVANVLIPQQEHIYTCLFNYLFKESDNDKNFEGTNRYLNLIDWLNLCTGILNDSNVELMIVNDEYKNATEEILSLFLNYLEKNMTLAREMYSNGKNTLKIDSISNKLSFFITAINNRENTWKSQKNESKFQAVLPYEYIAACCKTIMEFVDESIDEVCLDNEITTYNKIKKIIPECKSYDSKENELLAIPDLICGLYSRIFVFFNENKNDFSLNYNERISKFTELEFKTLKLVLPFLSESITMQVHYNILHEDFCNLHLFLQYYDTYHMYLQDNNKVSKYKNVSKIHRTDKLRDLQAIKIDIL